MRYITRHFSHYLPLVGILTAGVLGFLSFSYDKSFQAMIGVATAAAYVVWGVVHHHLHRDLHFSVFIEYIAVAGLGVVIIFSLLFRA